jgi:hypothetical protein
MRNIRALKVKIIDEGKKELVLKDEDRLAVLEG